MGRWSKRKRKNDDDDDDNGFGAWGGYMAAKKSKLLEQYAEVTGSETNKLSDIFRGISVSVNGYTTPSAEELKNLMALHGGIYHHYHIPAKTTHIIASNLPDTKIKQLGWNNKIVRPEWIVDSIKANKLLNYSNYLLYTNHNRLQPKLNFQRTDDTSAFKNSTETDNGTDKVNDMNSVVKMKEIDVLYQPLSPDIFDDEIDYNKISKDKMKNDKSDGEIINNSEPVRNTSSARTLNATDPRFLSEFYNNSRLHHISTLGAMFKNRVIVLRKERSFKFVERENLKRYVQSLNTTYRDEEKEFNSTTSVIMHIDMDCFFVSVGLRNRPELIGQPVAVTHSRGGQEPSSRSGVNRQAELDYYKQKMQNKLKNKTTNQLDPVDAFPCLQLAENQSMSEIASCSYEARKTGVKNGMFMGTALKLCPNLKTIPYDFEGYKQVANSLYDTIFEYTLDVEAVSCDEMYVDVSEILKETGATVEQWATYIRDLIQKRTRCPCSAGFGSNRLQARMATKTAKPNGQYYLQTSNVENYMSRFKVDDLPGVGRSTTVKLNTMGIETCGDLQSMGLTKLQQEFGHKIGRTLYQHCRGIDERPLVYKQERRSVSSEVNYGIRFKDNIEAENFIKQLVQEVYTRLTQVEMKGKCITLKLMVRSKDAPMESSKYMGHGVCDCITKSTTLSTATSDLNVISREIFSTYKKLNLPPTELRGIGIQISRLEKLNKSTASTKNVLTDFLKPIDLISSSETVTSVMQNNMLKPLNITIPKIKLTSPEDDEEDEIDPEIDFDDFSRYLSTGDTCSREVKEKLKSIILSRHFKNKSNIIEQEKESPEKKEKNQIQASSPVCVVKPSLRSGKGRGRPRGNINKNVKNSKNMNIYSFLKPELVQKEFCKTKSVVLPAEEIDLKFLAELPEDIRQEVIREYNLQNVPDLQTVCKTSVEVQEYNKSFQPKMLTDTSIDDHVELLRGSADDRSCFNLIQPIGKGERAENITVTLPINNVRKDSSSHTTHIQLTATNFVSHSNGSIDTITQKIAQSSADNHPDKNIENLLSSHDSVGIFMQLSYKQIKQLFKIWANTHEQILYDDIEVLKSYFSLLAHQNKMEDLFMLFKFMYSQVLKARNCNWHVGYLQIVCAVQDIILKKYGGTLWVYKQFHCNEECKTRCEKLLKAQPIEKR